MKTFTFGFNLSYSNVHIVPIKKSKLFFFRFGFRTEEQNGGRESPQGRLGGHILAHRVSQALSEVIRWCNWCPYDFDLSKSLSVYSSTGGFLPPSSLPSLAPIPFEPGPEVRFRNHHFVPIWNMAPLLPGWGQSWSSVLVLVVWFPSVHSGEHWTYNLRGLMY